MAIIMYDHVPLQLDISFPPYIKRRPTWGLDVLLLRSDGLCSKISKSIATFLVENKSDSVSYLLLWETLKAVQRGEMSFSSMTRESATNFSEMPQIHPHNFSKK